VLKGPTRLDYRLAKGGVAIDLQSGAGRGDEAQGDRFTGFEIVLGIPFRRRNRRHGG
jgi:hypothetical protein